MPPLIVSGNGKIGKNTSLLYFSISECCRMNKKTIFLIHILFWILYVLVPELPYIFPDRKYPVWLFHYNITTEILNIVNFYLVYSIITVNLFHRQRITSSLFIVLAIILVYTGVRLLITRAVSMYISGLEELASLRFVTIMVEFVNSMLFSTFAVLMKFMIDWFSTQKIKTELMAQKQNSELALLRTQINPHFLFNTLNNLYSLVYKKSEEAPSVVMKLAEIMRYMLYDANAEKVMLEKEISYLQSFIELQQLRLKTHNFISLDIRGDVNGKLIPPMLLIPFVENAFKHGKKDVTPPGIMISLSVEGNSLEFTISNYCSTNPGSPKDSYQGIGLQNVARRLQLMYPDKHQLTITPCGDKFQVTLHISTL
ncbi:MAG: histidine kinase [Bacteroidetes bacterium]|nr:histidine kinase [Bacteroidota bacterium]